MKAVSLRLTADDLGKIRHLARRLGVRDSDIIRLAIRNLLVRLSPLTDGALCGGALMPFFLEVGSELSQGLELNSSKIGEIINDGAPPESRVSADDVHMLTVVAGPVEPKISPQTADRRASPMRRYLYEKYLFKAAALPPVPSADEA